MELSSSQRKTVEHQFDSFCKKIMREEHRDIIRALQRKSENVILFCEMSKREIDELMTMDKYESDIYKFLACGFEFEIESDLLAVSLSKLPVKSRDILLLSYFLDMSDVEIANALDMARSTVQYRRLASLNQLKKHMGGKNNAEG
jgi:RNA polymerase sigma factor (sigma-70 family)